jgi:F-type H+-transporting ATPase subunit a
MHEGIAIHLAPKALFHIGAVPVTNTFLTAVTVALLLVLAAFFIGRSLRLKPKGFQTVLELLIMYPYTLVKETMGNDKVAERVFPIIMSIFLFVLAVNWFGLFPFIASIGIREGDEFIPFFYPGSSDLNLTLALSLVAFFTIEIAGIVVLGALNYGRKFITFKSPIKFAVGLIELVSELARLISFSFRLFGNIFAGKVLILVIMFFVPYLLPVPFLAFEAFVGFIQAAIFALLTLFFTKIAIQIHEEHASDGDAHHLEAQKA